MKKILLLSWAFCLAALNLNAQNTYVPDDNFEQRLIMLGHDNVLDNYVLTSNISGLTSLNLNSASISDLTGIDDFTSLTYLELGYNSLTSLDLSNNTSLTYLECHNNLLTSLDVSYLTSLTHITCENNAIDSLDFSNLVNLVAIVCGDNDSLVYLDVRNGNNSSIAGNNFNVTNTANLSCISVDDYLWSDVNWPNTDVNTFFSNDCNPAPPALTYVPDDNFEQALIDLGYDTALDDYVVTDSINNITQLNIQNKSINNLRGLEDFVSLTYLRVNGNTLDSLILDSLTLLEDLYCYSSGITELDVSNNTMLEDLHAGYNTLGYVDLSNNLLLVNLSVYNAQLDSIDVSMLTNLKYIELSGNNLTELDLSNNTLLQRANIGWNDLTEVDVSNAPNIYDFRCSYNELDSLDLTQNTALTRLHFYGNNLTEIDLSNNNLLTDLQFGYNAIDSIYVGHMSNLEMLYCESNNLTALDVSNNTLLEALRCSYNDIHTIDVSTNSAMIHFQCMHNEIDSLDLNHMTSLATFYGSQGTLEFLDIRNGNNSNLSTFQAHSNNLPCISVSDSAYAAANFSLSTATAIRAYCVGGCTDVAALNYDTAATYNDNSCIMPVNGCTSPTAANYNPSANVDDGSCSYPLVCSKNAIQLNGTNQYLHSPFDNYTYTNFTLEGWFRTDAPTANKHYLSLYQNSYMILGDWSGNNLVTWGQGLTPHQNYVTHSYDDTEWNHIAYVFDGNSQKIYINGVLAMDTATTGSLSQSSSYNSGLTIGARYTQAMQFVDGAVTDIRIWNTARDSSDIRYGMHHNLTGNEAGLVAYYPFTDGPGSSIVTDHSVNANHLTLHNLDVNNDWISVNFREEQSTTISACGSYFWNDSTYTQSGSYSDTLTTISGCDSIVHLNLSILPATTSTDTHIVCDSMTWIDGNTYTSSNNSATHTLTAANGCDSVVTLDLTVYQSSLSTASITACDSYVWIDGNTYTSSNNSATFTLQSIHGCDSIVSLNLNINHTKYDTSIVSSCDSYEWNGTTYTQSGMYNDTITPTNNLNVGDSYGGGTIAYVFQPTDYGYLAGQTKVLIISAEPTTGGHFGDGSCWTLPNGTYNTSANFGTGEANTIDILTGGSNANYASTWVNNLSDGGYNDWFLPSLNELQAIMANSNSIGGWLNDDYRTSTYISSSQTNDVNTTGIVGNQNNGGCSSVRGVRVATLPSVGCDSIVTLDLTINNSTSSYTPYATYDSAYTWNGVTYDSTGVYHYSTTNAVGCDSVATLYVQFIRNPFDSISTTFCANDTTLALNLLDNEYLIGNGTNYTNFDPATAGVGTHQISAVYALDQAYTIDSSGTFAYIDIDAVADSVYLSDDDFTHYDDGMYPIGFNFSYWGQTVDSFNICSNGWVSFDSGSEDDYAIGLPVDDEEYDNSIFLIDVDLDPSEGDGHSTGLIKHAVVGQAPNRILVVEYDSVPYYEDNDVYYSAQLQLYESSNVIEIHTLDANNMLNGEDASQGLQSPDENVAIIVPGRDDQMWSASNELMRFTPMTPVSDTITTQFTVLPLSASYDSITVCDSILWNGSVYNASGDYQYVSTGANGCDSIAHLHLNILNSTSSFTAQATYDATYLWNGQTLDSSGVYTYQTTNAVGCDSTAIIEMVFLENPFANLPSVLCANDSSFTLIADSNETITGLGLDSNLTFHVDSNGVGSYTFTADYNMASEGYLVSQAGSFNYINIDAVADTFDVNGNNITYFDAIAAPFGFTFEAEGIACDTLIFLDAIMAPISPMGLPIIIASAIGDFGEGFYELSDSNATVRWGTVGSAPNRVFVLEYIDLRPIDYPSFTYNAQIQFYEGSNRIEIHTQNVDGIGMGVNLMQFVSNENTGDMYFVEDRDGTQSWSAFNDFVSFTPNPGLSASVSHTIEVFPVYETTENTTACDSYTWNNGMVFTSDTNMVYTYQTVNGCDSTVTLNLSINNSSSSSMSVTACDSYDWNGNTYTSTGTYTYVTPNSVGCDSTVTLNLTINNSAATNQQLSFDVGDSVVVGNSVYFHTGIYVDSLLTANGCDSIITTDLTVFYYEYFTQDITICANESFSVNGNTYTQAGVYVDTIPTAGMADSVLTTTLSVLPVPAVPVIYQMWSTTLSTTAPFDGYQWYLDGTALAGETNQTLNISQSGVYTVEVFNNDGCGTFSNNFGFGVSSIADAYLNEFNLYPNPTRGVVHLDLPQDLGTNYHLEVYDFTGRLLRTYNGEQWPSFRPIVDFSQMANGNYKVVVKYENGYIWNQSVIKQ